MPHACFERFELTLSRADAIYCSQPGQMDGPVGETVRKPYVSDQLDDIGAEKLRAELAEYGAWDAAELADDDANRERIVWLAACNLRDEGAVS